MEQVTSINDHVISFTDESTKNAVKTAEYREKPLTVKEKIVQNIGLKIFIIILGVLVGVFVILLAVTGSEASTKEFTEEFDSDFYINQDLTSATITNGKVTLPATYVSARVVSDRIYTSSHEIVRAQLDAEDREPSGSSIVYYISVDDGQRWKRVESGLSYEFSDEDGRLKWMAVLSRDLNGDGPTIDKISITYTEDSEVEINTNDSRRRNDLSFVAVGLNTFYSEFGVYPHVSGTNSIQRWNQLQDALNIRSNNSGQYYVDTWPQDPLMEDSKNMYEYDYINIDGGSRYVLAALLEDSKSSLLNNDLDGTLGSIDCGDPIYCIENSTNSISNNTVRSGSDSEFAGATQANKGSTYGTPVSQTTNNSGSTTQNNTQTAGQNAVLVNSPQTTTRVAESSRTSTIPMDHPARISVATALSKIYGPLRGDPITSTTTSSTTSTTQTANIGNSVGSSGGQNSVNSGSTQNNARFNGANGSTGTTLSRGHLVTVYGDPEVYEIINGQRHWIPNQLVFEDYGFRVADIQRITRSEFNRYPRAKLLRVLGSSEVYYLTEVGRIRLIPSLDVFHSYTDRLEDIVDISIAELNSYPRVKYVYLETREDSNIWLIDNNTKYPISQSALQYLPIGWRDIAPVNRIEFDYYRNGDTIN